MGDVERFRAALLACVAIGAWAATGCGDSTVTDSGGVGGGPGLAPQPWTVDKTDKIDLLFVVDNSPGMADKQTLLADAVPHLVRRLVDPMCVNSASPYDMRPANDGTCAKGYRRQFPPVTDINVAVITSSLGGHGSLACSPAELEWNPAQDDRGRTVGSVRTGLAQYKNHGFLAWDPDDERGGESDPVAFTTDAAVHVMGAGEAGCEYESTLESWYRFLIDPAPPLGIVRGPCSANDTSNQCAIPTTEVDSVLLAQRALFLRPDSALAIVMVTDENDCSVRDGGSNWVPLDTTEDFRMPRASAQCASNPDDPCCYSCGTDVPQFCEDGCTAGSFYERVDDHPNLRCFDQKRRFGIDFLNPIWRYSDGLKSETICPQRGVALKSDRLFALDGVGCDDADRVQNPIYPDATLAEYQGVRVRRQDHVFFAGIVGVPYQDIERTKQSCDLVGCEPSPDPDDVEFHTASELEASGRFELILGDPTTRAAPLDPLMIESVAPRTGAHPFTFESLQPPTASEAAHSTNGHEYLPHDNGALQYACTYKLAGPRSCAEGFCDCTHADTEMNPLCQSGDTYSTTEQYYAGAHPGTRHLQVLRAYGNNSIVTSICPKQATDSSASNYGYRPAMDAVADRLAESLGEPCLPRSLSVDETTNELLTCKFYEFTAGACGCDAAQRRYPPHPTSAKSLRQALEGLQVCDGPDQARCADVCICEVRVAQGNDLERCQNEPDAETPGYCYVDETTGDPDLIARCPAFSPRRFIYTPAADSIAFFECQGPAIESAE